MTASRGPLRRAGRDADQDWAGDVVLIRDQDVVGFCEFRPTRDPDDDRQRIGHIMRLCLHALHQGQRGKLLVESACARLAGDGYLRDTPRSAQESAARVGYDSGAALSRVFARREGALRGAWRRSRGTALKDRPSGGQL